MSADVRSRRHSRCMTATEPGLVLPEGALSSGGPYTFPPFPGVYEPGVPVPLAALGLTAKEAKDRVKELGLPLKEAKAEPVSDTPTEANVAASEPEGVKPSEPTEPAPDVEEAK